LAWQGHRGYRRPRDTRLPTVLLVFFCGVLVWVLIGPKSTATVATASTSGHIVSATGTPGASPSPQPLPACGIGDIPAWHGQLSDWQTTLLDTTFELSSSYAPADLVPVSEAGISGTGEVRSIVIGDLRQLKDAASGDGVNLTVNSAYRSYLDQSATYDQATASFGPDLAALAAAKPGHSEHQLGTAIDFGGDQDWLLSNAWRFGFVSSFPVDSSPAFTCYKYEPWHYRYFGRDIAASIHSSGLTPREWLWLNYPPPPGYLIVPTPVPLPSPTASPSDSGSQSPLASPPTA
jgi:D-alanyl-D-alanine carboxypeptidase